MSLLNICGEEQIFIPTSDEDCECKLYQGFGYNKDGPIAQKTVTDAFDSVNSELDILSDDLDSLGNALSTEIQVRTNADTLLRSDLTTEQHARASVDINLQEQIDAITSQSDVVDVVGTYQDLVNYDTEDLFVDDIIKVLVDESHRDAISYYRWKGDDGWLYIGSQGPFYTKSETDTLIDAEASVRQSADNALDTRLTAVEDGKVDKVAGKGLSTNDYTNAEKNKLAGIQAGAEPNVQSDWSVTDTTSDAYIKNKPTIPTKTSQLTNDSNFVSDANYVHTDNNFTDTEKSKLSGIATGAEVNIQADWNVTDTTSDAYIKNKPSIPSQVVVDSALSSTSTNPVQNKVVKEALDNKVDVVSGKGLSTNDYTTAEKNKLAGIAAGAEVNQNAFSKVAVGSTTISADSKTDTLTLVAGSNVTLTPDATNDKVTIDATDTTYGVATTSANGLMSSTDKTKLNGIATGAEVNVQSDWNVTSTTSDAYIKNKPTIPNVSPVNCVFYGTCTTAAATKAKIATLADPAGFSLTTGISVVIKFTYASAAATMTLNVGGTGAKNIYRYGTTTASSGTTTNGWQAGAMVMFTYDGTGWVRDYWYNTTYSLATVATSGDYNDLINKPAIPGEMPWIECSGEGGSISIPANGFTKVPLSRINYASSNSPFTFHDGDLVVPYTGAISVSASIYANTGGAGYLGIYIYLYEPASYEEIEVLSSTEYVGGGFTHPFQSGSKIFSYPGPYRLRLKVRNTSGGSGDVYPANLMTCLSVRYLDISGA